MHQLQYGLTLALEGKCSSPCAIAFTDCLQGQRYVARVLRKDVVRSVYENNKVTDSTRRSAPARSSHQGIVDTLQQLRVSTLCHYSLSCGGMAKLVPIGIYSSGRESIGVSYL